MKKEYLAQYKQFGSPDKWWNAGLCTDYGKKYFDNIEDARKALEKVKQMFPDIPRTEVIPAGMLSVSVSFNEKEAHDFAIAETRIRVREVTDWEEVE